MPDDDSTSVSPSRKEGMQPLQRATDLPPQEGPAHQYGEDETPAMQAFANGYPRNLAAINRRIAENQKSLNRWLFVGLCMPFLLGGSIWRDHHRNQQVLSSTAAGDLQDLRSVTQPRGFKPVVLVLKTSTGFVSLTDTLSLASGVALVREERQSGRSFICDVQRTQCAEIAQPSGS